MKKKVRGPGSIVNCKDCKKDYPTDEVHRCSQAENKGAMSSSTIKTEDNEMNQRED